MGKVRVVTCGVEGCSSGPEGGPFETDPECSSVSERTTELKEHVYQVHTIQVERDTAEAAKVSAEASKIQAEAEKIKAEALVKKGAGPGQGEKNVPQLMRVSVRVIGASSWPNGPGM